MDDLTPHEIERLNAFGPYNHAVWKGRGITLSHEESISGRGHSMVRAVRDILTRTFTREEMKQLSLIDVGCYDGWILDQLQDLPFGKLIGIEPRQRNIDKGNVAREILRTPSRAEFRVGTIQDLGDETFDVVVCLGLLHHLESVGDGLRSLLKICRRKLIVETVCLSSEQITPQIVAEIEPKDIVYFGREPLVGLCGYKFESGYYHGSAIKPSIVSIPSASLVKMFLEHLGCSNIEEVIPPSAYWTGQKVARQAKGCMITADAGASVSDGVREDPIVSYERAQQTVVLRRSLIEPLYRKLNGQASTLPFEGRALWMYFSGSGWQARILLRWMRWRWPDSNEFEIIKNIRYAPFEKCTFEMAKILFAEKDFLGAVEIASRIAHRLNADWRAIYRAFVLVSRAYRQINDSANAAHYKNLALTANPELPELLFSLD